MALGVVFIVASSLLYDVAVIFLALAARHEHAMPGESPLTAARRAEGIVAQAMNLAAWGCEVLGLARLPLTLARVLGASGQVILLVLARLILKEPIGRREVAGAAAVCLGIAAVGAAPPVAGETASVIAWLPVLVLLGPPGLFPTISRRRGRPVSSVSAVVGAGLAFAVSGLFTKLLADDLSIHPSLPLLVALAGTGIFAVAGSLNEIQALAQAPAAAVAPIGAALQLIVPLVCAPILFGDRWPAGTGPRLLTVVGGAVAVGGAILLARATAVRVTPHTVPDPTPPEDDGE
jgi:drug/metabolite transporter (DMT)-like permease